jgi:hypothetical protein
MRLRRMAAGSRVSGQACVCAVPRCQRGSGGRAIRTRTAQVLHFAGLRTEAGCSMSVAIGLQPSVAANRAGPIWHVYPKGARREAASIFARYDAAGRGILKGQAK